MRKEFDNFQTLKIYYLKASWGASHPELLTKCEGIFQGKLGPINPTVDENYDEELFQSICVNVVTRAI